MSILERRRESSLVRYRHLGKSGLEVSETGLGANSFGEPGRRDFGESEAIVHAAIEHGINFVDTSNVYAQGLSEEYIGRALAGRRHEMLIGTKFGSMRNYGPNLFGGGRKFVMDSIEGSLKRLRTDFIDLYMIHRPDPRLPIEETLRAMDDIVRQGKALYVGVCNFEAWRVVDAVWTCKHGGLSPVVSSQFEYSMLFRNSEAEMLPACRAHGIGVMPYLPLAAGFLTGKVDVGGQAPTGTRLALDAGQSGRWITEGNLKVIGELRDWARERGKSLVDLAFAWLLADPIVGTVIAGASSPEQIEQNARASDWQLSSSERAEVTAILDTHPQDANRTYYSVAGYFGEQVEVVKD